MNVLVIPHVAPSATLRIRSVEIARALAKVPGYRVSLLGWHVNRALYKSFAGKCVSHVAQAVHTSLQPRERAVHAGVQHLTLPHLLSPYPLHLYFNERSLAKLIRDEQIDCVINANGYWFRVPRSLKGKIRYVYDLVDDHLSPRAHRRWQKVRDVTMEEMRKADHVITISLALRDRLLRDKFVGVEVIPNGTCIADYRADRLHAVAGLRCQFGVGDAFLLSYIGNHSGAFSNMAFFLNVFARFRRKSPRAYAMIVGPVSEGDLARFAGMEGVVFVGSVPVDDVPAYFQASDLGVLPFLCEPFTDNALPLKILEYGAARKRVVASPLKELSDLRFPHVRLTALDEDLWVASLIEEQKNRNTWHEEWDGVIDRYDWSSIVTRLLPLLAE